MPAAERQAGDACGRNDARWDGQSEGMGGVIYITLRAPCANPSSAPLGINTDTFHRR